MLGTVGILNVGAGDTKLSFDKDNPQECIRAARIVKDMIRRGYALLVEVEENGVKRTQRAYDFIEGTCEYVIADLDPLAAAEMDTQEHEHRAGDPPGEAAVPLVEGAGDPGAPAGVTLVRSGRRPRRTKRVAASTVRATAVAHSAGG